MKLNMSNEQVAHRQQEAGEHGTGRMGGGGEPL